MVKDGVAHFSSFMVIPVMVNKTKKDDRGFLAYWNLCDLCLFVLHPDYFYGLLRVQLLSKRLVSLKSYMSEANSAITLCKLFDEYKLGQQRLNLTSTFKQQTTN